MSSCVQYRHGFLQQLGRPVGNPPYHPDGPPWLAVLRLRRWYTYLVYPQHKYFAPTYDEVVNLTGLL
jgi:hypothetical protein